MPRELVKIVCTAVSLERDAAGEIVGEVQGTPVSCYSPEQLASFFVACKKELADWNAEEAAATPNRASRRRAARAPRKKGR